MHASLRALLSGLIDYAGLFPPASLPLEPALDNYLRYRTEPEAWMLGRFICPAGRLEELAQLVREREAPGPPLAVSVLAGKGATLAEISLSLDDELKTVASLEATHGKRLKVEALETRLPAAVPEESRDLAGGFIMVTYEQIESQARDFMTPFFEVSLGADWRERVPTILDGFARATLASSVHGFILCHPGGLKVRCGGLEALAFLSSEQVAFVITQCRDRAIACKATAGLHHPLRRFDAGLGTHMHGFVNVFGAAVLAHARTLSEEQVRQIIEDEDPAHFVFDEQGFRWNDLHATTAEISAAREKAAISFGSCSFDEPREDLRALGWLE
jgi:hypothetical protein